MKSIQWKGIGICNDHFKASIYIFVTVSTIYIQLHNMLMTEIILTDELTHGILGQS